MILKNNKKPPLPVALRHKFSRAQKKKKRSQPDLTAELATLANDFDAFGGIEKTKKWAAKVSDLLAQGADATKVTTAEKETLLHLATKTGEQKLVKRLLKTGIYPDAKDSFGQTPLHTAAEYEKIAIARILISAGADVNSKGKDNDTPLMLAARNTGGVAKLLLEKGADVTAKNRHGKTALDVAQQFKRAETLACFKKAQDAIAEQREERAQKTHRTRIATLEKILAKKVGKKK